MRLARSFAAEKQEEVGFGKLIGEPDAWCKAKNGSEVEATMTYDISKLLFVVRSVLQLNFMPSTFRKLTND